MNPYTTGYGGGSAEKFASGNVPTKADTIRMLLVKEVNSTNSGGGGSLGQVLSYTGSTSGLVPTNPNQPAVAYDSAGVGRTYTWSVSGQAWQ